MKIHFLNFLRQFCTGLGKGRTALLALALLVFTAFSVVGAVLTADLWVPVVMWTAIILGAGYLVKSTIGFKKEQAKAAYAATVKATASECIYWATCRYGKNFPIGVQAPLSSELAAKNAEITWRGVVPIVKVKLLLENALYQSDEAQCYVAALYLQQCADKFCIEKGLERLPSAGNYSFLTVLSVQDVGKYLEIEMVQVDKKSAVDFLQNQEPQQPSYEDFGAPQNGRVLTDDDFI